MISPLMERGTVMDYFAENPTGDRGRVVCSDPASYQSLTVQRDSSDKWRRRSTICTPIVLFTEISKEATFSHLRMATLYFAISV